MVFHALNSDEKGLAGYTLGRPAVYEIPIAQPQTT